MAIRRPIAYLAVTLSVLLLLSSTDAQTTGGVASEGASGSATPPTNDPKVKPWKFLASPMGSLNPSEWTDKTFHQFADPESWDCKDQSHKTITNCTPTPRIVEKLVSTTLGNNEKQKLDQTKGYVVIQIVDYGAGPGNRLMDAWYLYHFRDTKWTFEKFSADRIYGSPSIDFLFVHLNVPAVSLTSALRQLGDAVSSASTKLDEVRKSSSLPATATAKDIENEVRNKLQANGLDPDLIINLARANEMVKAGTLSLDAAPKAGNLIVPNIGPGGTSIKIPIVESTKEEQFQWLESYGESFGVTSTYANVHYESAVVKRTPANVANFLSVLKLLNLAQGARKVLALDANEKVAIWGAGGVSKIGLPSDVSIAGYRKAADQPLTPEERTSLQIGAEGDFNDEQLYWWDASIGIPVHKIKNLNYSVDSGQVIATQVDRQSAYVFFNLMTHPVDLSNQKDNKWPRLLVGFPLASTPWDRLFAGAGIGIPLKPLQNFQFFAGSTFNRNKQPQTLKPGDPATTGQLQSNLKITMTPKFTFGINVPVLSVFDKLMRK